MRPRFVRSESGTRSSVAKLMRMPAVLFVGFVLLSVWFMREAATQEDMDIASFVLSMPEQHPQKTQRSVQRLGAQSKMSKMSKAVHQPPKARTADPPHKMSKAVSRTVDPPHKYRKTDNQVKKLDLPNQKPKYLKNCLQPDGPVPVILMSLGRSGSSAVWQVVSNLTGEETNSDEVPGQNTEQSHYFFEQVGKVAKDHSWVLARMCQQQQQHPKAGIVGFKWKPNTAIHHHEPAKAALTYIAQSKRPRIKILRSKRNLIDVLVSREKHDMFDSKTRQAHCQKGDQECLEAHRKTTGSGVYMKPDLLLQRLKRLTEEERVIDQILSDSKIDHLQVSYEDLFYPAKEEKGVKVWKKVFDFLGSRKRPKNISMRKVEKSMSMAATSSSRDHRNILQNFDEVARALKGTEFFDLLRSDTPIAVKKA